MLWLFSWCFGGTHESVSGSFVCFMDTCLHVLLGLDVRVYAWFYCYLVPNLVDHPGRPALFWNEIDLRERRSREMWRSGGKGSYGCDCPVADETINFKN